MRNTTHRQLKFSRSCLADIFNISAIQDLKQALPDDLQRHLDNSILQISGDIYSQMDELLIWIPFSVMLVITIVPVVVILLNLVRLAGTRSFFTAQTIVILFLLLYILSVVYLTIKTRRIFARTGLDVLVTMSSQLPVVCCVLLLDSVLLALFWKDHKQIISSLEEEYNAT